MVTSAKAREHNSRFALLLIDVISPFEFPDGEEILEQARLIVQPVVRLKRRARAAGVPTIYVNDNFGDWRSERSALVQRCVAPAAKGADFVSLLEPDDEDYFVLKPMHSAFYETPLETLLRFLGTRSLILAGLTTNSCITCTAHDANMRQFQLYIPSDCSSARSKEEHQSALLQLKNTIKAKIGRSASISFRTK